MVDAVRCQRHHRPARRQFAIEQRLTDRARALEGFAERQRPPGPVRRPLSEEDALRRGRGPVFENLAHAPRIDSERLRRSKAPATSFEGANVDCAGRDGGGRRWQSSHVF